VGAGEGAFNRDAVALAPALFEDWLCSRRAAPALEGGEAGPDDFGFQVAFRPLGLMVVVPSSAEAAAVLRVD